MMFAFCGKCYLRSYLASKLFIPYVILKKLRFQYFLSIAWYNETKYIIDYVSCDTNWLTWAIFVFILMFHQEIKKNFIVGMV